MSFPSPVILLAIRRQGPVRSNTHSRRQVRGAERAYVPSWI
jgi:hypothetical protein